MRESLTRILFLSFLILNTTISLAQQNAQEGQVIQTTNYNSSTAQIGEIKQALLTQSEFQSLNGDCWVMMSGQNISGSDYANLTGRTTLPNAAGRFLRATGGNAAILAQTQEDDLKSHNHSFPSSDVSSGSGAPNRALNKAENNITAWHASGFTGGVETRPKNLSVNFFIKINKQCNFN